MKKFVFLLLSAVLFLTPFSVSAQNERQVIREGSRESMKIALTFDDGPHPYRTDDVLRLLEQYGIRATFFVIGENVSYYPEPFKRTVAAGHEIGNHTYHHKLLSETCEKTIEEEIRKTDDIIFRTAGYRPKIFRPPEGAYSDCALKAAKSMDYSVILWTVDTRDWEKPPVQVIVDNVMKNVKGGSILLFHDYMHKNAQTLEALEILIPKLLEKGYEFVTVSELIA
ncbi:MAG: polysaccharide deacetylase family protein [Clostridia bacterium]|nr:polysaccharide deacetylase family protein [Clostridia bacterium]